MAGVLGSCSGTLKYLKFQPGDINGFLQLFFDNLGTVLALIGAMRFEGFAIFRTVAALDNGTFAETVDDIIFRRSIPGLGITIVFGNLYYAWMALRLMKKKEELRDESPTTALPYGVNTPGAFAFIFSIILPAVIGAQFAGGCFGTNASEVVTTGYEACLVNSAETGWTVGVTSNFVAGLVSIALGFIGNWIPLVTPVVALLTSLAGIGISFLGIGFLAKNFAEPLAGLLPLFLIWMTYFSDVKFGPIPISLVIIIIGMILGWADSILTPADLEASTAFVKPWGLGTGFEALSDFTGVDVYIGTTIPVAIAAAAGSLMNVFSARRAGDDYGIAETMISDGVGTMIGALFGTPFGTSVYIGHPAYKQMGAGAMYSVMNCIVFFFFSVFGVFGLLAGLIPETAVSPLLVFVGFSICKEALEEAKPRHYPAYMLGILPDFVRWVLQQGASFNPVLNNFIHFGMVAMSRSSLLVSLILTASTVYIVDRRYLRATAWLVFAAFLSLFSIIHQAAATIDYITELGFGPGEPDSCFVGFGYCNPVGDDAVAWVKATPIRFMGGYLLVAAATLLFWVLQNFAPEKYRLPPPILDEDEEPAFNSKATAAI